MAIPAFGVLIPRPYVHQPHHDETTAGKSADQR